MNLIEKFHYFYLRKVEPGFKIPKNALVVDIGSGDKPFWRGDVFVDRKDLGNVQRTTHTKTIHDLGIFVDADVTSLPFKNKTFDFSFTSHLLEHVDDPAKAIREIMRISKAGYIEVPNGVIETMDPFDSHLWFIYNNNNSLFFYRKSKTIHKVLEMNGVKYRNMIGKVDDPFIRLYWDRKIDFEIVDSYKKSEKFYADNKKFSKNKYQGFNLYLFLVKILRKFVYKEKTIDKKIFEKSR